MRFGSKDDGNARALSVVADEARRRPAPELDWDALEQRLERAVQRPGPVVEARRPALTRFLLPAAGLAAAAAAIFLLPRPHPAEPVRNVVAHNESERNGDSVAADELLLADERAVSIVHPGRARWTLEPHSRALVLDHGDVVRVHLVAGAMKAEVVPSRKPERFVVEAAGTRVAVHGTVFRVRLEGERAVVDVEQGVVAVGPRERPERVTATLHARAHAEFTLEGAAILPVASAQAVSHRLRIVHPTPAGSVPPVEPVEPVEPVASVSPEPLPDESAPHPLTIGEAEAGVAKAIEAVVRCFEEHTEGSHAVRVRAQTELTLDVSGAGLVTNVSFTPPLSPLVQSCAKREVLDVQFARSSDGAQITRTLELTR